MKKSLLFCLPLMVCACSPTTPSSTEAGPEAPHPYGLKNTEVRDIHSKGLNRDYQLFIGLPDDYAEHPNQAYPVLFVTDADYAFPLIRSVARRVGNHGEDLRPFILVGLSYAKGDSGNYSRNRDYTPSKGGQGESGQGEKPYVYGEADAYKAFIKSEVFALIAKTYRADMTRKIFAGHSYGGLLGADILLSDPGMFDAYILSSPSLWFDNKIIFAREAAYAKAHKDLSASVFMATGGFETIGPDRRNNTSNDLVADMYAMEKILKSRRYPHLTVQSEVITGEDHLTVAPDAITHGLLWALGTG
jgi:predicted alpha/beta superfamily hydrolase